MTSFSLENHFLWKCADVDESNDYMNYVLRRENGIGSASVKCAKPQKAANNFVIKR